MHRSTVPLPLAVALITGMLVATDGVASPLYTYNVVVETGDPVSNTGAMLSQIGEGASINSFGNVAFEAAQSNGLTGVFYKPVAGLLTSANPALMGSTRIYSAWVMLDSTGHIVAQEHNTSPQGYFIRSYNSASPGSFTFIASGNPTPPPADYFESVYAFPSISEDGTRYALGGLVGANSGVATPKVLNSTFNFYSSPTMLKPKVSDSGAVVFTAGIDPAATVTMTDYTLTSPGTVIADGFQNLGRAPSISDDGVAVAYAGDNGVYLSVETAPSVRETLEVAEVGYTTANGEGDLGKDDLGSALGFASIDITGRVGVLHQNVVGAPVLQKGDTLLVSFVGTPNNPSPTYGYVPGHQFAKQSGLWVVQFDYIADVNGNLVFRKHYPMPVVQVGDNLALNNTLTVTSIGVPFDPLAKLRSLNGVTARVDAPGEHQLVVFVGGYDTQSMSSHGYLLRAVQQAPCLLPVTHISQGVGPWASHQLDSSSLGHKIQGFGCALTAFTMQTNLSLNQNGLSPSYDPLTVNALATPGGFAFDADLVPEKSTAILDGNPPISGSGIQLKYVHQTPTTRGDTSQAPLMQMIRDAVCSQQASPRVGVEFVTKSAKTTRGPTTVSVPSHYVDVTGVVRGPDGLDQVFVSDPGDVSITTLASYDNFFETTDYITVTSAPPKLSPLSPSVTAAAYTLYLHSTDDVAFILVDSLGNRTGRDLASFATLEEIPNSHWEAGGEQDALDPTDPLVVYERLTVDNITAGTYALTLLDQTATSYTLSIELFDPATGAPVGEVPISNVGVPGQLHSYSVVVPSDSSGLTIGPGEIIFANGFN